MMKKKLNINWTIVALILTIIGVGYFITLVHEVNEKDREREYTSLFHRKEFIRELFNRWQLVRNVVIW